MERPWTSLSRRIRGIGDCPGVEPKIVPLFAQEPTDHPQAGNGGKEEIDVEPPAQAVAALVMILTEMAESNSVTLIPIHVELTTQEAADLLNVSRPYLIKLIEEKKLPCRKVHTHRRIAVTDLLEFKQRSDARGTMLQDLADDAQENGMGY